MDLFSGFEAMLSASETDEGYGTYTESPVHTPKAQTELDLMTDRRPPNRAMIPWADDQRCPDQQWYGDLQRVSPKDMLLVAMEVCDFFSRAE